MFPRESDPKYETMEEAHYTYSIRNRLRKEVLVPLRKALELPEVYIGTGQWNAIPYNRVALLAMKRYKELFLKRDEERFNEYLEKVKAGMAKIAAGGLLPHEIIRSLMQNCEDGGQVAELQWKRMVDDLAQNGKLKNCIAIFYVSGSMNGTPMEVSRYGVRSSIIQSVGDRLYGDYKKFTEKGYGSVVPEIIFWNLRDSHSTPVIGNQNGVALVSGFSKNLLKLFLKDGVINPEAIMLAAISGEEYEDLMVVD
ncbi:hypothetical protein Droror1_Dr00003527 [Drosera rotundifolia]